MIEHILADELVRLAMASDGISEQEMQRLLEHTYRAILRRDSGSPSPPRGTWGTTES